MNNITYATRKYILEAIAKLGWNGKLREPDFLNKIFDLQSLKSGDPRYSNMYDEIIQHRENNDDYDDTWFVTDPRLNLLNISDDLFEKFILLTINPDVVSSPQNIDTFVQIYNNFLMNDCYGLVLDYISGEITYKLSKLSNNELLSNFLSRLIEGCINISTDGEFSNSDFLFIKQKLREDEKLYQLLPEFVLTSYQVENVRTSVVTFYKNKRERINYIRKKFRQALLYLNTTNSDPDNSQPRGEGSIDCNISNDNKETAQNKTPKIFISHSSKDSEAAEMLVDLIEGMGIPFTKIFCTSVCGLGASLRENIYGSMRKQFNEHKLFVLFLLSSSYYQSPACLNEMGATWILELQEVSILLPKFDFSQITGALDPRNICIKIDSSDAGQRLTELREKLCEFMGINISSTADSFNNWERKRDNFLKRITALSEKDSYEINS